MRTEGGGDIFLFESSTHVFWAEEVAREGGIPMAVIPAPKEAPGTCGLAIQTSPEAVQAFMKILKEEGILFQLFP